MAADKYLLAALSVLVLSVPFVAAADPDPLMDYDINQPVQSQTANGSDFASAALASVPIPSGKGFNFVLLNTTTLPGINTEGVTMASYNFSACGQNPIHSHPRASEILFVTSGTLYCGFVDGTGKLFAQTLTAGSVFIFPRGLIHWQQNPSATEGATAVAAFNSQSPGLQVIAQALLVGVPASILEVNLGLNTTTQISQLQALFAQTGGNVPGSICNSNPSFPST